MTQAEFEGPALTDEQREAMKRLQERSGIPWVEFLERAHPPVLPLAPYVGIKDFHGMFVGIEPDGYTHT